MKIRNIAAKTAAVLGCSALLALVPALAGDHAAAGAVSYTHLTLPTILLV